MGRLRSTATLQLGNVAEGRLADIGNADLTPHRRDEPLPFAENMRVPRVQRSLPSDFFALSGSRGGQNAIGSPYALGECADRLFPGFKFRTPEMLERLEGNGVL